MEYGSAKFDTNGNLIQQPQYTPSTDIYRASYSDVEFMIRRIDYRYGKPCVDFITSDFIAIMDNLYNICKTSNVGGIAEVYFTKFNKNNAAVFRNISDASQALIKIHTISSMSGNPKDVNCIFYDIYPITRTIH